MPWDLGVRGHPGVLSRLLSQRLHPLCTCSLARPPRVRHTKARTIKTVIMAKAHSIPYLTRPSRQLGPFLHCLNRCPESRLHKGRVPLFSLRRGVVSSSELRKMVHKPRNGPRPPILTWPWPRQTPLRIYINSVSIRGLPPPISHLSNTLEPHPLLSSSSLMTKVVETPPPLILPASRRLRPEVSRNQYYCSVMSKYYFRNYEGSRVQGWDPRYSSMSRTFLVVFLWTLTIGH